MKKSNDLVILCIFRCMILGLATGYVIGVYQKNIGISMSYGLILSNDKWYWNYF
ncbi:MAG: hypothetical protein ACLR9T_03325 [Thomasclavelia sp.]|uniref:hypothetical protein n=1 Tax=Thomasclavelia sp. TaxID=3025757 RepID=UPI0039A159D8